MNTQVKLQGETFNDIARAANPADIQKCSYEEQTIFYHSVF
jgi:hypothetical protein